MHLRGPSLFEMVINVILIMRIHALYQKSMKSACHLSFTPLPIILTTFH